MQQIKTSQSPALSFDSVISQIDGVLCTCNPSIEEGEAGRAFKSSVGFGAMSCLEKQINEWKNASNSQGLQTKLVHVSWFWLWDRKDVDWLLQPLGDSRVEDEAMSYSYSWADVLVCCIDIFYFTGTKFVGLVMHVPKIHVTTRW